MAQTRRKRTRKHRGTPAGTIERSGRTGRPQTRREAKQISRQRGGRPGATRFDKPPTWKGAIQRAAIAAVVFGVLLVIFFKRNPAETAALVVPIFFLYIPLGYATDNMIYRFRQRRQAS